ncbi:DUF4129 domain-containing protein [Ferrimicrobium sp.]|uniref:DUF4129 domain-containing protein n=1 Tax=Ferrimicrobium sp. TaxID=2926050 RepID=UPI002610220F|nr:DUF4129 domain-containing protein [Ferrimicrobium sp.]
MTSSKALGRRWVALVVAAILIVGTGVEGLTAGKAVHTGVDHRVLLTALVRALISALMVLFVVGVGLLVFAALRRNAGQGTRWFTSQQSPFTFPLWLRILIATGAIFFLAFLGFLFYALAPRRKHRQASIERPRVSAGLHAKGPVPVPTHFNYLLPIVIGLLILVVLSAAGLLRQRARRRSYAGREHALTRQPGTGGQLRPIQELETIEDPRDQILACWGYAESRLAQIGFTRLRYETSIEFVRRLAPSLPFPPLELQTLANLFVEARYSNHRVSQRDGQLAYTLITLFDAACTRSTTYA